MTVTSDRVQVARERAEHDRVDRMTHTSSSTAWS
jgi:hypothetical protein